jgi:hypothetical protein
MGRRKKSDTLYKDVPYNYCFWQDVLKNPNQIEEFFERGSKDQLKYMRNTLLYMKKYYDYQFQRVDGENILKRLEEKLK